MRAWIGGGGYGTGLTVCLALASSSQPYFSAYAHARAKVGGEGKEKYVWADPGFCDSVVCAEYLPRVHNDY